MKRYSEAINDLNAAIEADPTLSEAYRHKASILRQLCRFFANVISFYFELLLCLSLFAWMLSSSLPCFLHYCLHIHLQPSTADLPIIYTLSLSWQFISQNFIVNSQQFSCKSLIR